MAKPIARGIFTRASLPTTNYPVRLGVQQIFWDDLEPTQGNYDGTTIDAALAKVTNRDLDGLRMRVFLGRYAPTYAMNLGNGPLPYIEPQGGASAYIPDLWNSQYQARAEALFRWIAANYDSDSRLVAVFASGGMTYYAEPFIKGINNAENRTTFLAAGYTQAKDKALMKAQFDWMSDFTTTPIGCAYNPWQYINSNGGSSSSNSFMGECMDYHIAAYGQQAFLQNNSIRSSYIADVPTFYAEFLSRPEVQHQFQCAAAVRVGDEAATIQWGIDYLSATGIEHSGTLTPSEYAAFDAALTANFNVTVGQATETDRAFSITVKRVPPAVGQVLEDDDALPVTPVRTYAIGQASETDTADTVEVLLSSSIGTAIETDEALAVAPYKTYTLGQATETDAALTVTPHVFRRRGRGKPPRGAERPSGGAGHTPRKPGRVV